MANLAFTNIIALHKELNPDFAQRKIVKRSWWRCESCARLSIGNLQCHALPGSFTPLTDNTHPDINEDPMI